MQTPSEHDSDQQPSAEGNETPRPRSRKPASQPRSRAPRKPAADATRRPRKPAAAAEEEAIERDEDLFAAVISGEFDVDGQGEAAEAPAKRVLLPQPDAPKLHKVLAQGGLG